MIIVEIFPICDVCDEPFHDCKEQSKAALRRSMRRGGWVKLRDGRDKCWVCVDREKKGAGP